MVSRLVIFQNSPNIAAAARDIFVNFEMSLAVFIPNIPKKACYFLFILQGKEIWHFT